MQRIVKYGSDVLNDALLAPGVTVTNALDGLAGLIAALGTVFQYKGGITLPADFPTLAAVQNGWCYTIFANVTDNNPAKTNTGQSFLIGDEIAWVAPSWVPLGPVVSGKADKVAGAVAGNFAGLDAFGNLTDSGFTSSSFDAFGTAAGLIGIHNIASDVHGILNPSAPTIVNASIVIPRRDAMAIAVTKYLATAYILCTTATPHTMATGEMIVLSGFVANPGYNTAAGTTVAITAIDSTSFTVPTVVWGSDESGTFQTTSTNRLGFTGMKPDQTNKYWSAYVRADGTTENVLIFGQSIFGWDWTEHLIVYNSGIKTSQFRGTTGGSPSANIFTRYGYTNIGINFPTTTQVAIAAGGVNQVIVTTAGILTTFVEKTTLNTWTGIGIGLTLTTAEIGSTRLVNWIANAAGTDTTKLPVGAAAINGVMARIHNSGTNNLTVSCDTTGTINGAASYVIPAGGTLQCEYNHASTDWKVT
jgi:hypothetical protein